MSAAARGYGETHRKLREQYRPQVEAGHATCARCLVGIASPGDPCPRCGRPVAKGRSSQGMCGWDLGHDDYDRSVYTGPEHSCCNRRAGGRRGGRIAAHNLNVRSWSRKWLPE